MKLVKQILPLLAALVMSSSALGQVRQSGTVTQGHVTCWSTSGVVQDCGTAASGFPTSFGVTNNGGPGICVNSAAITQPFNRLCLSVSTSGAAQISLQNNGGAVPQGLQFNINGTIIELPSTPGDTFVTATAPFAVGNVPCFRSTSGDLQDCGLTLASGVVTSGVWHGTPVEVLYGGTGAATAAQARTNLGLGTIATQDASAVAITGGSITGMPSPSGNTDVATKGYVDATVTGLTVLSPSRLATTTVLANTPTYSNGASGVGATLTAGSNGALSIDSVTPSVADIVLIKNQTSTTGCTAPNAGCQNGIYTVTAVGDGSNPYVLTRATYFDTAAEMLAGSYTFVTAGSVNMGSAFVLATTVTTVGTTPVTFYTFSSASSAVTTIDGQNGAFSCSATIDCTGATLAIKTLSITNSHVSTSAAISTSKLSYTAAGGNAKTETQLWDNFIIATNYTTLSDAITAAGATKTVYLPCGTYTTSTAITVSTGVSLQGESKYCVTIETSSATLDVLVAAGFNRITGMTISSSVLRSAGSFVKFNGVAQLSDFVLQAPFLGITLSQTSAESKVLNGSISNTVPGGTGMLVGTGTTTPPTALFIDSVVVGSSGGPPSSNLTLASVGDMTITNTHLVGAHNNLLVIPGSSQSVVSVYASNVFFDQASVHNINMSPSSNGAIAGLNFVNIWAAQGVTTNILLASSGSTSINGLTFTNLENYGSAAGNGIYLNGPNVKNISFIGGQWAGNNQAMVTAGAVDGVIVSGVRIGPNGRFGANTVGVSIGATATNMVFTGNNVQGNGFTNFFNGSAGTVCRAGNLGITSGGCP